MDQNLFVDASRPRQKFQFIITLDAAQLRKDRGQVPLLLHGKILLEESQPFKAGMLVIQIDDRRYIFSVKLCWLAKTVHAAKHGFRQERFILARARLRRTQRMASSGRMMKAPSCMVPAK